MKSLKGRRVLVTGGTGFIGSRLVALLLNEGADVHLLVRESSSSDRLRGSWERVERHSGDIGDRDSLTACVCKADPHIVCHLAKERHGSTFEKEVAATLLMADVLSRNAKKLTRWVRTAHAVRAGYGRKSDAYIAKTLVEKYDLPVITLELFQVYGPGKEGDDFLSDVVRAALAKGPPPKPGGGIKDFVFVDDVAEAYILAATCGAGAGRSVQIGTGEGRTEGELASMILEKLGATPPGMGLPARTDAEEGHPADPAEARRLLGWEPSTNLYAGLGKLIEECRIEAELRGSKR